jgi:hypothetical protein
VVHAGRVTAKGGDAGCGDSGSAGGEGGSMEGEAGIRSSGAGGDTDCRVTDGIEEMDGDEGESDGGVADGGMTMPGKGERSNSHSPSGPRSSSSLFLRFLVLFARGVITSGGEGGCGGVVGAGVGRAEIPQAGVATTVASTTGDGIGGLSCIAAAAWLRPVGNDDGGGGVFQLKLLARWGLAGCRRQ